MGKLIQNRTDTRNGLSSIGFNAIQFVKKQTVAIFGSCSGLHAEMKKKKNSHRGEKNPPEQSCSNYEVINI